MMSYVMMLPSWYPDAEFPLDGNFIARQAEVIHREVCRVKVLHGRRGPVASLNKETLPSGMDLWQFQSPPAWSFLSLYRLVSSWEKYAAAMIATYGKPNCIHVEVAWPALIPASRIAQKFNIPLLLTEHHSLWLPVRFSKEHRLKTYLLKKYGAQVSRISAVSEPLATAISRQLSQTIDITPNLVQEIYMSLPFKPQDPEAPVFLHVSNFAPVKQPSTILQAFVEAKKSGMKGRMLMAGEPGPLKSACQTFARQSIYKNDIDILDQMDASAMAQLIQRCDILVGFSLYETQGITLAEGFALGKQVIQSDLEVLHMYPDWFPLTRVRSSQELKEAMIHAAEKPHTAPKEDMRKVITNSFGTKAVADSFKQLYRL